MVVKSSQGVEKVAFACLLPIVPAIPPHLGCLMIEGDG